MRTPVVLSIVVCGVALAGDGPGKVDPRTPTKWAVGDVVTATVSETTATKLAFVGEGGTTAIAKDLATGLDARFTQVCLETTADGRPARSLVRIDAWTMSAGQGGPGVGSIDRCLAGALVETSPKGWRLLAAGANPSHLARGWLDTRFGADCRGFSGGLAELGAPGPVGAGDTWKADPPAIADGLAQGGVPVPLESRKWTFTVKEVAATPAGADATVAFDETYVVSGAAETHGTQIRVDDGSTVHVHGTVGGVPGLGHRTGRLDVSCESDLRTSSGGRSLRLSTTAGETETWEAGGVAPALPEPKAGTAAAVAIGAGETWAVGDLFVESGSDHVVSVTTPVDAEGRAGADERTEWTVTWQAEIACVEADGAGRPGVVTVAIDAWDAKDGDGTGAEAPDRCLAGRTLRVAAAGFRPSARSANLSDRARQWLVAHFGPDSARGDALRGAMTPVMLVAPGDSWKSDGMETLAALARRAESPMDPGSVEGRGTLTGVDADGRAALSYVVTARIACAPDCTGEGADVLKGTVRVQGTTQGPLDRWTLLGSFRDTTQVDVTLPGRRRGEDVCRVSTTHVRDVARSPLTDATRSARSWVRSATAKINARDFDGAIADCTAAIGLAPKDARSWFNRALAREGKDDAAGAIADYTQAIEVDPAYGAAHNNRGNLRQDAGDLDGALDDFTKAAALDPSDPFPLYNRARVRSLRGDPQGAIEDCTRAIEVAPSYAAAYRRRGDLRQDTGDRVGAFADWTQATQVDPANPSAHKSLARARFRPGLPAAEVVADLRKALAIDPPQEYARLWLFLARDRLGERESASAELTAFAATRKPPGADDWYAVLVALLTGRQSEDDAIAAAERAADEKTRRERLCEAAFYAAILRANRGDVSGSVALLDRCIATDVRNFTEHAEALQWRPALLLGAVTTTPERAVAGCAGARRVLSAPPESPAGRAGIVPDDVLVAVGGTPLGPGDLDRALLAAKPGTSLALDVANGAGRRTVEVTLGAWK